MTTLNLRVTGMSCSHCVKTVMSALESVHGVRRANVDLAAGRANIEYDEALATPAQLVGAVMDQGYSAEEIV